MQIKNIIDSDFKNAFYKKINFNEKNIIVIV